MPVLTRQNHKEIIDEAASQLVTTTHEQTSSFLRLLLLYPSGANVVVRVEANDTRYFVSDAGFGAHEADMMGASLIYARHGRPIAESAGIKFDNQAFFVTEASKDQLVGAVVTVAGCSQEATYRASDALAEKSFEDAKDRLYQRVIKVFDPRSVTKDASISGSSATKYHVAALVRPYAGHGAILFDPVTKHHSSVAHASMKFQDIARMREAPVRVAVVHRKAEFGTLLGVLSQSANVVDDDVPDDTFLHLAKAA
jgi:hypothetical protein